MSGSSVSVINTNSNATTTTTTNSSLTTNLPPTPLISSGTTTSEKSSEIWGGSIKGKVKRSKPRLGGGWGCCLDCAAGEDRPLVAWEESETSILLLRELIGTFSQLESLESQSRVKNFLQLQLQVYFVIFLLFHFNSF